MKYRRPAVFFDRDGVLNVDSGYLFREQDFAWMPGAIKAIQYFNKLGFWVFVITNQSGIARGLYTEADVLQLHQYMDRELAKNSAHIDKYYYCPHYIDGSVAQYAVNCYCRKPEPGMINQAVKEWAVDPAKSIVIGDKKSDLTAAQAACMQGFLFPGGDLFEFVKQVVMPQLPDYW